MSTPEAPRQLRGTCDSCIVAKVKCSQHRPQCQRCARRGDTCIYNIDRKATRNGATSRKNRHRSNTGSPTVSSSQGEDEFLINSTASLPTDLPGQDDQGLPVSSYNAQDSMYIETSLFPPLSMQYEAHSSDPRALTRQSMEAKAMPHHWPLTPASSRSELFESSTTDCYSAAVAILSSMQFGKSINSGAESLSRMSNANTYLDQLDNQQPVSFHHVLATCSIVSSRMFELLECSCCNRTSMVLLYGSIMSNMMYWLQKAIEGPTLSQSVSQGGHAGQSQHSTSNQTSSHCPSPPVFTDQPIMVGGNLLEHEDQLVVRKTLVLGKLKQVMTLIDRLAEVIRVQNSMLPEPPHSYTNLINGLQTDAQKLLATVRGGIFPAHGQTI